MQTNCAWSIFFKMMLFQSASLSSVIACSMPLVIVIQIVISLAPTRYRDIVRINRLSNFLERVACFNLRALQAHWYSWVIAVAIHWTPISYISYWILWRRCRLLVVPAHIILDLLDLLVEKRLMQHAFICLQLYVFIICCIEALWYYVEAIEEEVRWK